MFDDAQEDIVRDSISMIEDNLFGFKMIELKETLPVPDDSYVDVRKQYYGGRFLDALTKIVPDDAIAVVGYTHKDLFVGRISFVFGVSDPKRRVAVVSTQRLKTAAKYRYRSRIAKVTMHELGHLFGLEHPIDKQHSFMGVSGNISELDYKARNYSPTEIEFLRRYFEKELELPFSDNPVEGSEKDSHEE